MLGTEFCEIGQKVRLRDNVLQRHARSVPAHAGYTSEQFRWRDLLRSLAGKEGVVDRHFPNSAHVNVRFDEAVIGIDCTELVKI